MYKSFIFVLLPLDFILGVAFIICTRVLKDNEMKDKFAGATKSEKTRRWTVAYWISALLFYVVFIITITYLLIPE